MNIVLVSQCTKKALTETRRIIDQFAERRGDRTWQTSITSAGLDTLRKLLKKTARKNTAVACHWIRGRDHSELLWVVGDPRAFNRQGAVPTNTTAREVLHRHSENEWHSAELIRVLSGMAALLHDIGKACEAFQKKLITTDRVEKNIYRHEWISLRLWQAFVGTDTDEEWIQRCIRPTPEDEARWLSKLESERLADGIFNDNETPTPFTTLPPIAQALGWLVLTHHRLPMFPNTEGYFGRKDSGFSLQKIEREGLEQITSAWNESVSASNTLKQIRPYWTFAGTLPMQTEKWKNRMAHMASRLEKIVARQQNIFWVEDPFVMHLSRLCLMVADHYYSGLIDKKDRVVGEKNYSLYANTTRQADGKRILNQPLDEHLLGVEKQSGTVSHALPLMEEYLPRLRQHKGLKKRTEDERFRWQDKAFDLASGLRQAAAEQGAFLVNMASTGCGKTLANAKIMYALSDPDKGMRCAFALGLRTLTLQTGNAYRQDLQLAEDDVAVRVGGTANRTLYDLYAQEAESSGSESSRSLIEEDAYIRYEGSPELNPLLARVIQNPQVKSLLLAPLLVCTIDHLVPATESERGGHQIAPMLRLLTGDLVLDEPDDFDLGDLPALTRLVHWAGLLGSRVLLSSATLPPALIQGLFEAYREGRLVYQRHRGEVSPRPLEVVCAWFDEHKQTHHTIRDLNDFQQAHQQFVDQRSTWLASQAPRRVSKIIPLLPASSSNEPVTTVFARTILDSIQTLHQQNALTDPTSGKQISIGLVRMANIRPIVEVALALYALGAPEGVRIHLCTYHSQYPLCIRSAIEHQLDTVLNRRNPEKIFQHALIRAPLDQYLEPQQIFVVLASPVAEVGRDHDYCWAIAEPSSMRSLIQLAGRIRRHRPESYLMDNYYLLDTNVRHLQYPNEAAFCLPGFEGGSSYRLKTHALSSLLQYEDTTKIDARPRLTARSGPNLHPKDSLVDLEHARLFDAIYGARIAGKNADGSPKYGLGAATWWRLPKAHLLGAIQQHSRFRSSSQKQVDVVLLLDEELGYALYEIDEEAMQFEKLYLRVEKSKHHVIADEMVQGIRIRPWGMVDYVQEIERLAEHLNIPEDLAAKKFGVVKLRQNTEGWRYHPALGFSQV